MIYGTDGWRKGSILVEGQKIIIPAGVTYLIPFQVIRPDHLPPYSVSLDEINANTYEHGILSKVVAAIAEPQPEELPLLVCFDGGLALPVIAPFNRIDDAIARFNRVLCALLLGGIEVEAIDSRHVVLGSLWQGTHVWPVELGLSLDTHLHSTLRTHYASSLDAIVLNQPKNNVVSDILSAHRCGDVVLNSIPNLSPTFLLRGHTELKYKNWSDALANLSIAVEQLTDYLWEHAFLQDPKNQINVLPKRLKSLREDSRTWTLVVRQEMLWQEGILPSQTYELLFPSRQARNNLIHEGTAPDSEVVRNLYEAVLQLLENIGKTRPLGIRAMDVDKGSEPPPNGMIQSYEGWRSIRDSLGNIK